MVCRIKFYTPLPFISESCSVFPFLSIYLTYHHHHYNEHHHKKTTRKLSKSYCGETLTFSCVVHNLITFS